MHIRYTGEVLFDEYCKKCEHEKLPEDKNPCYECLKIGFREDSRRPQYFKEKRNFQQF